MKVFFIFKARAFILAILTLLLPNTSYSSVNIDVFNCQNYLIRILAHDPDNYFYEFDLAPIEDNLSLYPPRPPTGRFARYVFSRSIIIKMAKSAMESAGFQKIGYSNLKSFFETLPKRNVFNFTWLKNGKFRIASRGTTAIQDLVSKHIVLSQDESVFVAGELIIESDGRVILIPRTGTFSESSHQILSLVAAFRASGVRRVQQYGWDISIEIEEMVKSGERFDFAVTPYNVVNLRADISLLARAANIKKAILNRRGGGWDRVSANSRLRPDVIARPQFQIGSTLTPELIELNQKILNVIDRNPSLTPFIGDEPEWSYLANEMLVRIRPSGFVPSKLLLSLAIGMGSEYVSSGLESDLEQSILTDRRPKLWPDVVFELCYRISGGDLLKAFITCQNVLSYGNKELNRHERPIQSKLAYIRNDSQPLGDNFGAWYHIFGAVTYALVRNPIQARAVIQVESFGSMVISGRDRQEELMGKLGIHLATNLKRIVRQKGQSQPRKIPNGLEQL